jgi:hypothetical protein
MLTAIMKKVFDFPRGTTTILFSDLIILVVLKTNVFLRRKNRSIIKTTIVIIPSGTAAAVAELKS